MSQESSSTSFQLPNAIWGTFDQQAYARDQVNAHSPGFGEGLQRRFSRVCRAFGSFVNPPRAGGWFIQVPVLSDVYLRGSSSESPTGSMLRPGVLAVAVRLIGRDHMGRPGALGFHGIFLGEDVFAAIEDQSYTLWKEDFFFDPDSWDPKQMALPYIELSREQALPAAIPAIPPRQVEVLGRQMLKLLRGSDLEFPMLAVTPESERHMSLLQLGLPRRLRHDLGFVTQMPSQLRRTTSEKNDSFGIRGVVGSEPFDMESVRSPAGRQPFGADEALQEYSDEFMQCLSTGDLARLLKLGRREILSTPAAPPKTGGLLGWLKRS